MSLASGQLLCASYPMIEGNKKKAGKGEGRGGEERGGKGRERESALPFM